MGKDSRKIHDRFDVLGNFVYFILAHDDAQSGFTPFTIVQRGSANTSPKKECQLLHYEETVIGSNKPVIFYFKKTSAGYSRVIIRIKHLEDCGVSSLSSLFRQDALTFAGEGNLYYTPGEWKEDEASAMTFTP